jgi:RecA-family ATPase
MTDANVRQFPGSRRPQPFQVLYPASWYGTEPEPVRWLVRNCVPRGTVVLLSGDSGLGKSLLMQQLQTCLTLGRPWLGFEVECVRSFGFYCEDPRNILELRQLALCTHFGVDQRDLEDMSLSSRVGMDNILMDFKRRTDAGKTTAVFEQIRAHISDFGAQLVIIDTLAHTFNGNENIRAQVTAFVSALQQLATEMDGAVILNSHPSVSSMASGTGYSGSTAWRASVRAHMYLKRPKGFDDEADEADNDERILKTMKSNWGPGSGVTKLRWQDGVFVRTEPERAPVSGHMGHLQIRHDLLEAVRYLIRHGERVAAGSTSRTCLSNLVKNLPSCRRYKRADILYAQDKLLEEGKLVIVELGPPSRRYSFVRTDGVTYPGEEGNPG